MSDTINMNPGKWEERSASITKIAAALSKAQAEIEGAVKGSVNPHFRSKYADLGAVVDAIREPFAKYGLAYIQEPGSTNGKLSLTTTLLHESGEYIRSTLEMPVTKHDPQGYGSAITYGRRYALLAMAGIAPEDDDGNAASAPAPQKSPYAGQGAKRAAEVEKAMAERAAKKESEEDDLPPDLYLSSDKTEWLYALPYQGYQDEKAAIKEAGGGWDKARKIWSSPRPIDGLEAHLV